MASLQGPHTDTMNQDLAADIRVGQHKDIGTYGINDPTDDTYIACLAPGDDVLLGRFNGKDPGIKVNK